MISSVQPNIPTDIPTDIPLSWVIVSGVICALFLLWVAYQFYEGWVGEKCKHCKCRSEKWLQWHQMDKDDYRGYIWCPVCFHECWQGFQDRVFG